MVTQIEKTAWLKCANGGYVRASHITAIYLDRDRLVVDTISGETYVLDRNARQEDVNTYLNLIMQDTGDSNICYRDSITTWGYSTSINKKEKED